jgi:hypothetical protein
MRTRDGTTGQGQEQWRDKGGDQIPFRNPHVRKQARFKRQLNPLQILVEDLVASELTSSLQTNNVYSEGQGQGQEQGQGQGQGLGLGQGQGLGPVPSRRKRRHQRQ